MLKHGPKTECDICHSLVYDVKKHKLIHETAKCKICGITFKKRGFLKHLNRMHKIAKDSNPASLVINEFADVGSEKPKFTSK